MAVLPTPPFWLHTTMRRTTEGRLTVGAGFISSQRRTAWASPWMRETPRSLEPARKDSHWPAGSQVENDSAPEVSTGEGAEARALQWAIPW